MKIYTKGGDGGETALFFGPRVRKDDLRVEAYGSVDELNAVLGLVRAELSDPDLSEGVFRIQHSLFDLGGELATPESQARTQEGKKQARVVDADVEALESWIDQLQGELEPLRNFILPGGTRAAGLFHLARTVCRRAERRTVSLAATAPVSDCVLRYLNRLSDLLFVLARVANHRSSVDEPVWEAKRR
ncbi:MAG: cob(I)yrinic acid a,c-diamide adenosyltransferase [Myxococcota bacterium]|nr:cob(I)yrinic acid a,c-diamide adenosyltransferase [Myxococcota bacterium]